MVCVWETNHQGYVCGQKFNFTQIKKKGEGMRKKDSYICLVFSTCYRRDSGWASRNKTQQLHSDMGTS